MFVYAMVVVARVGKFAGQLSATPRHLLRNLLGFEGHRTKTDEEINGKKGTKQSKEARTKPDKITVFACMHAYKQSRTCGNRDSNPDLEHGKLEFYP